jgi:hypothetical protein
VEKGETLTFRTTAYVEDPSVAEVKYMMYRLTLDGVPVDLTGQANPHVAAREIAGKPGYYETTWEFRVPDSDSALGLYKVDVDIRCAWKEQVKSQKSKVKSTSVAGVSDNRGGVFSVFRVFKDFINKLFGQPAPTPTIPFEGPFPTTVAGSGRSPKLGTFFPVPTLPPGGCTFVYFQVVR